MTKTFSISETMDILQVSENVVLDLIKSRRLIAANISRAPQKPRWRISEKRLNDFLTDCEAPAIPATPKARAKRKPVKDHFPSIKG